MSKADSSSTAAAAAAAAAAVAVAVATVPALTFSTAVVPLLRTPLVRTRYVSYI